MTLFHLDILKCATCGHDERDADGFQISMELFGLVIQWVLAVRK